MESIAKNDCSLLPLHHPISVENNTFFEGVIIIINTENMAKCKFKIRPGARVLWECPLEALPGEEYCYWHREEEGKEPDDAKLRELKENKFLGVFLRKANLVGKELQEAFLWEAMASAIIISIFAFLFWLTNGIVKNVNGKMVAPDSCDYVYHSVIHVCSVK